MSTDLLLPAFLAIKTGFVLTLTITLTSFVVGQVAALPIALALTAKTAWLRIPAAVYTFLVRGSPLLIQLFIVYYGLGQIGAVRSSVLWPVLRSALDCAILTIGLNSAAYMAEALAGAIRQLPKGQWEAGRALGLHRSALLLTVVLPQVYRTVLPLIGNEAILVLKSSTLASAITVIEMTGAARGFVTRTYAPFETFVIAGAVYLLLGVVVGRVFKLAEARAMIPGR